MINWPPPSLLLRPPTATDRGPEVKVPRGRLWILGHHDEKVLESWLSRELPSWQRTQSNTWAHREVLHLTNDQGPLWILARRSSEKLPTSRISKVSDYAWFRDQCGLILGLAQSYRLHHLEIDFFGTSQDQELGFLTGCEIYSYSYRFSSPSPLTTTTKSQGERGSNSPPPPMDHFNSLPDLFFRHFPYPGEENVKEKEIRPAQGEGEFSLLKARAALRGQAINLARHLVNMPANLLTTSNYVSIIHDLFQGINSVHIEVWDQEKLAQENMNLLLAVGQGGANPPYLVHIAYRPELDPISPPQSQSGSPSETVKPRQIVILGKGIVFDSGGLNIKGSGSMGLMKKDMAGSASALGLAWWAAQSRFSRPMDFYLPIAENAVDGLSMRPGDLYTSRSGLQIEIQNTDAEGRLVLADALDLAVHPSANSRTSSLSPELIIDLSTLTGACRVALGLDIAGIFSNEDHWAEKLQSAGERMGDLVWQLPLYAPYFSKYASHVGDFMNSTESGHGGAICAGLFLEKFVRSIPWIHIDMYAWTERARGALSTPGANGQVIQCMIDFLVHEMGCIETELPIHTVDRSTGKTRS